MKNLFKKFLIVMLSLLLVSPAIKAKAELQGGKWTTTINVYCDSNVTSDMKSAISSAINSWNNRLRSIGSNNLASHELGHVLGLDHTTTSSASVMKNYIQGDIPLQTAFDLAELDKIY